MADERGDRPKKTWREIDQSRGKSRPGDRDRDRDRGGRGSGGGGQTASSAAQKTYRAALERAFEAGTLAELAKTLSRVEEPKPTPAKPAAAPEATPAPIPGAPAGTPAPSTSASEPPRDLDRDNRMKMLARIREAEGRDPITRAIDAFLAKYPRLPDDFEVLTKALSHKDDDRILVTLGQLDVLAAREKPRRGRSLVGQLRFLEETHADPEIRRLAAVVRARL
jgi:hypothetical protein